MTVRPRLPRRGTATRAPFPSTRPSRRAARPLWVLLLAVVSAAAAAEPHSAVLEARSRVLAFERDGAVWVAAADGTGAARFADGADPCVSPDGRSVAFTQDTSGPKAVRRRIAIVDVATRAVRVLTSVPSDNAFRPVWSPDGSALLVYVLADKVWNLGLVKADDSSFRYVVKGGTRVFPCWSAAWAPDGASIFCQDLASLSRISLDGAPLWKAGLAQLVPGGGLNSGARISASPDGTKLLLEVEVDEPAAVSSWDGAPPAVYLVDTEAGAARRLTQKGVLAWQPAWLDAAAFLCVVQRGGDAAPSLVRHPFAGGAPVLLVKGARTPTVSAERR